MNNDNYGIQPGGHVTSHEEKEGVRQITGFDLKEISIIKGNKINNNTFSDYKSIESAEEVLFGFNREKIGEDDFVDCFYFTTKKDRYLGKMALLSDDVKNLLEELGFFENMESTYTFDGKTEDGIHLLEHHKFIHDLDFQMEAGS